MECPNHDGILQQHTHKDVIVFECPACRGIWFDKGELAKAEELVDPDLGWEDIELWTEHEKFTLSLSDRECPRDQKPMVSMEYGDTGVMIDHCLTCQGIWLDQGEFLRIIDAMRQDLLKTSSGEYLQDSFEEAAEVFTHPSGFATEWRDFKTVTRMLQYRILSENPGLQSALIAFSRSTPFK